MKTLIVWLIMSILLASPFRDALCNNGLESAIEGTKLSDKQVKILEQELLAAPTDLKARTKLLGYYMLRSLKDNKIREKRAEHIIWLIKKRPESAIAGSVYAELDSILDGDNYFAAKQLWKQNVDNNPGNTKILANAASFNLLHDRGTAEELLKRLQALEPNNPEWRKRLALLYSLEPSRRDNTSDENRYADALNEQEQALKLSANEEDKFYLLPDLAMQALQAGDTSKANTYANELLSVATKYKNNWNYGNAIHYGHTVLGRIACLEGRIELAKNHLLESSRIEGSPQLSSFGPTMELARELLKKGEIETVLQYLESCKSFWKMGHADLQSWINDIRTTGSTNFKS